MSMSVEAIDTWRAGESAAIADEEIAEQLESIIGPHLNSPASFPQVDAITKTASIFILQNMI